MDAYTYQDICAVVVSYNPEDVLIENIQSIIPQVKDCIVIDNGSTHTSVLRKIQQNNDVTIIELKENKGIAAALNVGLRYCKKNNYKLILTMDQDTVLEKSAVNELLKPINEGKAVSSGINWDGSAKEDENVEYLITSGNLVAVDAVLKCGGYDEALFIDSVDFDICLKLREGGYTLCKVANALAMHNLGESNGSNRYRTHSAFRYYYISRNHFYLLKKYKKKHRIFCCKKSIAFALDLIQLTLYDKERKSKYSAIWKGYKDSKLMK